jgi:hypothetical protein
LSLFDLEHRQTAQALIQQSADMGGGIAPSDFGLTKDQILPIASLF